jgi:catechol 2,3-dioxygenase-like lactoylglutathione lyase family enzyme
MIFRFIRPLVCSLFLLLWLITSAAFGRALEVKAITLSVSDLDRSVAFFEQALNFKKTGEKLIAEREYDYAVGVFGARVRRATLALGDETIHLEQFISPAGHPIPVDSRSNDLWFQHFAVVVSDMDKAFAHVQKFAISGISSAPQTIPESNKGAAGIKAYKFRDPDGHPLELLYFPADKGNPKWQRPEGRLFLGVDHTAIGIGNTERSTQFYSALLGFKVAGGGVNTGITQEQLDNAFGAVVRITGLRPERAQGPGLEFLQYVTPSGGRPAPVDKSANDLVATRLVLEVDNIDELAEQLGKQNVTFVSPRVTAVPGEAYGKCLMVKDPDGHMVMLVQR